MLLSMTGFGAAHAQHDTLSVTVELRAVNNRFLKITYRMPDAYQVLENEIDKLLRQELRRGTVQVQLQARRQARAEDYRLNVVALRSYQDQLRQCGDGAAVRLDQLLMLPGVVQEPTLDDTAPQQDWTIIERVVKQALHQFQKMRAEEGAAMERELRALAGRITAELAAIQARAPEVVATYRQKLQERLSVLLKDNNLAPDPAALVREVAMFADRSDITEEIVRLASHLQQYDKVLAEPESPGRKLDFLVQEMNRETNTIGSKANDVTIAHHVVEIKGVLEKIRELIQNVE